MFLALILDLFGQFLIFAFFLTTSFISDISSVDTSSTVQVPWLIFLLFVYPSLGWLFGSFTIFRWRHLPFLVLFQRLLITALFTLFLVSIASWFTNSSDIVWLLNRSVQLFWVSALTIWSLLVRVALRHGFFLPEVPKIYLLAQSDEVDSALRAWLRAPHPQQLIPIDPASLLTILPQSDDPILLVISSSAYQVPSLRPLIAKLELRDFRHVRCLSLLSLFEQQQERLPPVFISDSLFSYEDLPWAASFNVQSQLKRMADVFLSAALLFCTFPLILLSSFLIWLEDRGPIFFAQQRTGWLGRPFTVYKLRTMSVQSSNMPARWTQPGDQRITAVGAWLRRTRVDELPSCSMYLQVMSLIGPRPERPEFEDELEQRIPHYRKRHWMRPGLSGWAQVCAPYASSIDDSDLKLSYDLYYLRHFSTWFDFVILFRTVKTVLKAGGR